MGRKKKTAYLTVKDIVIRYVKIGLPITHTPIGKEELRLKSLWRSLLAYS